MTVDVVTETVIDRPVEAVSSYALDPSNAPHWYANIEAVAWKTSPPATVGTKVAFVARFLGRRLEYTYELCDVVPGERLVMRTAEGPFPMETTYTWAPVGFGSTRMTLRNRGEPAGFSKLIAPLIAPAMRRANRKDLAQLKEILEHEGSGS
ncbi:MAG: SRPBCC family protein [Actinomycetota bacterium]